MSEKATPSIKKVAFSCPYCTAYAHQTWWASCATLNKNSGIPELVTKSKVLELIESINAFRNDSELLEYQEAMTDYYGIIEQGDALIGDVISTGDFKTVHNLFLSECANCKKVSIWLRESIIYPLNASVAPPNEDLPEDIRRDYMEAASILKMSPRGSAALLRLCVQKLCKSLGEKGNKINEDIASLVKKGLDPQVQKALDIVRVIGNEAVHPGQIDLRDNYVMAHSLFGLVNMIANIMITQKKNLETMFNDLPRENHEAIARRDRGR